MFRKTCCPHLQDRITFLHFLQLYIFKADIPDVAQVVRLSQEAEVP
jgi:hypothetical protein